MYPINTWYEDVCHSSVRNMLIPFFRYWFWIVCIFMSLLICIHHSSFNTSIWKIHLQFARSSSTNIRNERNFRGKKRYRKKLGQPQEIKRNEIKREMGVERSTRLTSSALVPSSKSRRLDNIWMNINDKGHFVLDQK